MNLEMPSSRQQGIQIDERKILPIPKFPYPTNLKLILHCLLEKINENITI